MKTPQSNVTAPPKDKRPASAVASHLASQANAHAAASGDAMSLDADAYLNADNGWPATGREAAELQREYDALADLFLSEEPIATRTAPAAAPAAPVVTVAPAITGRAAPTAARQLPSQGVDCLMLGHLPVLASAWTMQFARQVAEGTGMPVALLRVVGGSLSLEVIFSNAEQAVKLPAGGPTALFDEALARARAVAPRLMIRVDETSELELLAASGNAEGLARVDRVSMLSGSDDVAIVATYRTIKHLLVNPALSPLHDDGASHPIGLGVAIMGAEGPAADDAMHRLNSATRTFLARTVDYVGAVGKLAPCHTSLLYRGEWARPTRHLLEQIGDLWAGATPVAAEPSFPTTVAPAPIAPKAPMNGLTKPAATRLAAPPAPPLARPVAPAPAPTAAAIAGLRQLISRNPYHSNIELAADGDGNLHLVAILAAGTSTAALASESIGTLLATASWATDHAELLALAHPDLNAARIKVGPELHLLTDDPRSARGVMNTGVRVHMLATVNVSGKATWVCTSLN